MLAAVAVRVVNGEAEDAEAEEQRAQSHGGGGGDADANLDDVSGPDWGSGVEEVGAVDEAMDVREAGDCGNARAVEMVRAERGGIVVVPGGGEERGGEGRKEHRAWIRMLGLGRRRLCSAYSILVSRRGRRAMSLVSDQSDRRECHACRWRGSW